LDFLTGVIENTLGMVFSAVLIAVGVYLLVRRHPEYWTKVFNRLLSRLSDFEYHVLEGRFIWKFRPEDEQQEEETDDFEPHNLPEKWYKPVTRVVRTYNKGSKTYTSHAIDFEPISAEIPPLEVVEYTLPKWFKNKQRQKFSPDSELRVAVWGGLGISATVKSGQHYESHSIQLNPVA
jgi:hypothetical protein